MISRDRLKDIMRRSHLPGRSPTDSITDELGAKVTDVCRTCNGTGVDHSRPAGPGATESAPCPDCPTIEQLLDIGARYVAAGAIGFVLAAPPDDPASEW